MAGQKSRQYFEDLFVLEMANNHWGSIERGLKIIHDHAAIARKNNVKAAIKLQFRDVDEFIHPNFKGNTDLRYVKKTEDTRLDREDFSVMVEAIKAAGCIPMATPFDEASVDLCVAFDFPLIKIASSDMNDWSLLEKVASTGRPVIVSTGGGSESAIDDLVAFFEKRQVPLAINHCVSLYPSEDSELELNQIDYLRSRYPELVIGFSTHEYHDWHSSMLISYAKGARMWERHVDIDYQGVPVSSYCSLPEQCDEWFQAFHKAREMCGGTEATRRNISEREVHYLDALVRGIYARRKLEAGYMFSADTFAQDFYLAVPLRKGQLSSREMIEGEVLTQTLDPDQALTVEHVEKVGGQEKAFLLNRGL